MINHVPIRDQEQRQGGKKGGWRGGFKEVRAPYCGVFTNNVCVCVVSAGLCGTRARVDGIWTDRQV